MKIDNYLVKKYNKQGPRYTSYPPANLFQKNYDNKKFIKSILQSNKEKPESISIYIHIPFCPQICHFCGCTTETGFSLKFIERYINALIKEIEMMINYIDTNRKVTQIHWGGGTPNAIPYKFIKLITDKIKTCFEIDENYEMAIECSPAYFTLKHIDKLKEYGFNRISIGLQDFDNKILEAINRKPSKIPIHKIINKIKNNGFSGTNIDLVYGLPLQTIEGFNSAVKKAIELDVDRIAAFSYAHVPSVIPRQKILEKHRFPSAEEKAVMYNNAYAMFRNHGYQPIGMDHFAKPNDDLSIAQKNKQLHRNFQGYCTLKTTGQVYGFGASSISQLHSSYSQNEKNAAKYIKCIENNKFATIRGYSLNKKEKIIRKIINEIMCNYYVDLSEVADTFKIKLQEIIELTSFKKERFKDFIDDNILEISDNKVKINTKGRIVIRNIAMRFDPLMNKNVNSYSKTI
tara:strand:- start:2468 stop:3844 length:1377 start_codon:yes stop_codon:yes gene_type:complete